MPEISNANWLQRFLFESTGEKPLCTKIYCTTCGALPFRRGLLAALAAATGTEPKKAFEWAEVQSIAKALASVRPPEDLEQMWRFEASVRNILFAIYRIPRRHEIEPLLSGSWAGDVLNMMKVHYEERQAVQRARAVFEDPDNVRNRRKEKNRLKQEKHTERLAEQRERSRLWHENHPELVEVRKDPAK